MLNGVQIGFRTSAFVIPCSIFDIVPPTTRVPSMFARDIIEHLPYEDRHSLQLATLEDVPHRLAIPASGRTSSA